MAERRSFEREELAARRIWRKRSGARRRRDDVREVYVAREVCRKKEYGPRGCMRRYTKRVVRQMTQEGKCVAEEGVVQVGHDHAPRVCEWEELHEEEEIRQVNNMSTYKKDRNVKTDGSFGEKIMIPYGIRVWFRRGQEYDSFRNKSMVHIGTRV